MCLNTGSLAAKQPLPLEDIARQRIMDFAMFEAPVPYFNGAVDVRIHSFQSSLNFLVVFLPGNLVLAGCLFAMSRNLAALQPSAIPKPRRVPGVLLSVD
jgi:hypothetical protein